MNRIEQRLDDLYEDFFRMDCLYGDFAKRYSESYHSLSVLYLLGESPDGMSQKQLAAKLYLPKQTVGSIVASLERKGLATHQQDEADRRSKLHILTPAGKQRSNTIMGELRAIELACVERIGEADMARAHEISKRYLELFKQKLEANEAGETNNDDEPDARGH